MQVIAPIWIMPWFYKFKPVESKELKDAVLSYADSVDYKIRDVYIIDASKRSTKSNAFFTGIGRSKRIALYDTLIEKYTIPEIVAILGHEIGHFKKKHVPIGTAVSIIHSGIMLFLLSLFLTSPGLYDAFGVQQSVYLGILFFGLLFIPLEWLLSILMSMVSRHQEYASDRFAATTISEPESSITALKKLASTNLANLTPHPLDVFVNYSHPPLLDRVNAIEKAIMK
jgi:STE24 endopeptidase